MYTQPLSGGTGKDSSEYILWVAMLWCESAQNIGQCVVCVHRMITMHDRRRQTDGQTDGRTSWQ